MPNQPQTTNPRGKKVPLEVTSILFPRRNLETKLTLLSTKSRRLSLTERAGRKEHQDQLNQGKSRIMPEGNTCKPPQKWRPKPTRVRTTTTMDPRRNRMRAIREPMRLRSHFWSPKIPTPRNSKNSSQTTSHHRKHSLLE